MEYVIVLIVAIVLWRMAVKGNEEDKSKFGNYNVSSDDNSHKEEVELKFSFDIEEESSNKKENNASDSKVEGRLINFDKIKYDIKPNNRKNKLLIEVLKTKKTRCKILSRGGYLNNHCLCLVEYTTGTVDGRVLGFKATENPKKEWIFEKAFDVKLKVGKFTIDEGVRYDVAEFDDIDYETIEFKYFKKGYGTYLIDNITVP